MLYEDPAAAEARVPRSLLRSLWRALSTLARLAWLLLLFSPAAAAAPLALGAGWNRQRWLALFRATLEAAGPAFIKWGQWAATRRDLFPPDFCAELARLHTQVRRWGGWWWEGSQQAGRLPPSQLCARFGCSALLSAALCPLLCLAHRELGASWRPRQAALCSALQSSPAILLLPLLLPQAPAHGPAFTAAAVREAFGFSTDDLFDAFDEFPLASGSIGQIHRAVLSGECPCGVGRWEWVGGREGCFWRVHAERQHQPDAVPLQDPPMLPAPAALPSPLHPPPLLRAGTGARLTGMDAGSMVAVKVRHPGVSEAIERDFALMAGAAALLGALPGLRQLRLEETLKQFAAPLREQVGGARAGVGCRRGGRWRWWGWGGRLVVGPGGIGRCWGTHVGGLGDGGGGFAQAVCGGADGAGGWGLPGTRGVGRRTGNGSDLGAGAVQTRWGRGLR